MPSRFKPAMAAAFLMAVSARAHIFIKPQAPTLDSGATRAFQVHISAGPAVEGPSHASPQQDWTWMILDGGVGTLDEATGVYLAPQVETPCAVRVRASHRHVPDITAEAHFHVVPVEPFKLLTQVLGDEAVAFFSAGLPFLDRTTGQRFQTGERVGNRGTLDRGVRLAGYGIPIRIEWTQREASRQLLSYGTGSGVVQRDVSGETSRVITPTAKMRNVTVESLEPAAGCVDWRSFGQRFDVRVRGVVPFVGSTVAPPDHRDGLDVSARFREPFGLARVPHKGLRMWECADSLVTDPASHVIRRVSEKGEVSTPWGEPGRAGHLDTPRPSLCRRAINLMCCRKARPPRQQRSLFNHPTFLAARVIPTTNYRYSWEGYVSDSGNHVVRKILPDGTVSTLAGVPGHAGHFDTFLGLSALFDTPSGLATDSRGNVFVADQGNCVIRRISPQGKVTTLAGTPGAAGSEDGPGPTARFRELKGLTFMPSVHGPGALYAVDGHAIRRISYPGGLVTTLLGDVDTPGFVDILGGPLEALRKPCLNHPCGISSNWEGLAIADSGNNAVRRFRPRQACLTTLAGDPRQGEIRWGLLRDGMAPPPGDGFATLKAPRTVVVTGEEPESFIVSTGSCIGEILPALDGRDLLWPVEMECSPARVDQPCTVRFTPFATTPEGHPSGRPVTCTVEFIEADGTLAEQWKRTDATPGPLAAEGTFSRPGKGKVIVRCVSNQGVSVGAQRDVDVLE